MAIQNDINYNIDLFESSIDFNKLSKFLSDDQIQEIKLTINNTKRAYLVKECYCKVENVVGSKDKLDFKLSVYTKNKNIFIFSKIYSFVPSTNNDSDNFIKQSYQYLKTLPEFSNAIDLLDEGQVI